jgi:hypothetical protein
VLDGVRVTDGNEPRPRCEAPQAIIPAKPVRAPTRTSLRVLVLYHEGSATDLLSSKEIGGNEFASVSIEVRSATIQIIRYTRKSDASKLMWPFL